jgi:hypothetical protein
MRNSQYFFQSFINKRFPFRSYYLSFLSTFPFFLILLFILCLWFRASLVCINNCPARCNTNQSIYYSASSLYIFQVSTTLIIRSTQICNYSPRYCAATSLQRGQVGHVGGRWLHKKYDQYRRL